MEDLTVLPTPCPTLAYIYVMPYDFTLMHSSCFAHFPKADSSTRKGFDSPDNHVLFLRRLRTTIVHAVCASVQASTTGDLR